MRIKPRTPVIKIVLSAVDDTQFDSASLEGTPHMISFFRFAGCPLCNMRVHELSKRYDELGENFKIIGIFNSSLENLQNHMERHDAPFPILADSDRTHYKKYGIEYSVMGVLKGVVKRWPTLTRGMLKGYIPKSIEGSWIIMPAEFLVDAKGTIQVIHYGKDEGDHMPFSRIKEFALEKNKDRA